jgi:hypothetical protein
MKKRMILKVLLVVGAVALLSGCMEGEPKSFAYYQEHIDEAKVKYRECQDKGFDKDCLNAKTALSEAGEVDASSGKWIKK